MTTIFNQIRGLIFPKEKETEFWKSIALKLHHDLSGDIFGMI